MNEDAAGYIGIGDYDPDSICNYLSNKRDQKNGERSRLSQGDIRGLLALYHRVKTPEYWQDKLAATQLIFKKAG